MTYAPIEADRFTVAMSKGLLELSLGVSLLLSEGRAQARLLQANDLIHDDNGATGPLTCQRTDV